jgi:hypothetical protein
MASHADAEKAGRNSQKQPKAAKSRPTKVFIDGFVRPDAALSPWVHLAAVHCSSAQLTVVLEGVCLAWKIGDAPEMRSQKIRASEHGERATTTEKEEMEQQMQMRGRMAKCQKS